MGHNQKMDKAEMKPYETLNVHDAKALEAAQSADFPFTIKCYSNPEQIKQTWLALERDAICTVFESYNWSQNWCLHAAKGAGEQPLIIVGYDQKDKPAFLFPMALVQSSVLKMKQVTTLTWLAQNYSSYNMPLCRADVLPLMTKQRLVCVFEMVRQSGFLFDALILTGQAECWQGQDNFMQAFTSIPAEQPIGLVIPLDQPFEQMHSIKVSKSTRKKLRSKKRQLEHHGAVVFGQAQGAKQRKEMYDLFLAYKAASLKAQQKPNVYEQSFLNDFFYALGADHNQADDQADDISAIMDYFYFKVGNEVLAVSYGLFFKNNFFGISRAMLDTPLAKFSPGIHMLMGELEAISAQKAGFLDLGPGDSVYKKHWGYEEVKRFDCHHGFNAKGHLYLKTRNIQSKLVARLKSHEVTRSIGAFTKRKIHQLTGKK